MKDKKKRASKASSSKKIQRSQKSPNKLKSWSRIKNDLESALTTWEGNALACTPGPIQSESSQTRSGNLNQNVNQNINHEQLQKIKMLLNSITQQLEAFSDKI